jgi:hypothetical protein
VLQHGVAQMQALAQRDPAPQLLDLVARLGPARREPVTPGLIGHQCAAAEHDRVLPGSEAITQFELQLHERTRA